MTSLTILGCGTSTGVPLIHCSCKVCRSKHPRNKRLRASVWLQTRGKSILIDTSPDLRAQAMREKIQRIDAVLFTHPHADHVHGIDELRSYNFIQKQSLPAYANPWTCQELKKKFEYIFYRGPVEGGGVPQLELNEVHGDFEAAGLNFSPIPVPHGSKETLGYRFDGIAYVTDCSYIPSSSLDRLKGLEVLVLDCLRIKPHPTHLNFDQALELISELRPKKAYLTHLGHEFDYREYHAKGVKPPRLPKNVQLAYDGLKIRLN